MVMYVARHVLDVSLFQMLMNKGQITAPRHYALTLGLWSLTMIVAMSTDDLGFILELIGAFGSSVSRLGPHHLHEGGSNSSDFRFLIYEEHRHKT